MKYKIKIITGEIHSGKTTYLTKILLSYKNVSGIVQLAEKNKRFFLDVTSGVKKELTAQKITLDTFTIGKFIFRKSAFIWAKEKLRSALKSSSKVIVIDEFGLLELHGEGLEPVLSKIINKVKSSSELQLIIVIRKSLLTEFFKKFNIKENEVEIKEITN